MRLILLFLICTVISYGSYAQTSKYNKQKHTLHIEQSKTDETIAIYSDKGKEPILTQVAKINERPYLHPIIAPDGKGVLTEYRPAHHLHQTGIYWGLKLVNGRDYFMNWNDDYWRGISANVIEGKGKEVKWQ